MFLFCFSDVVAINMLQVLNSLTTLKILYDSLQEIVKKLYVYKPEKFFLKV